MKKAAIIYNSRTGTTKKYAEQIGDYLSNKGVKTNVLPIQQYDDINLDDIDYLLLGCWTNGLMFFLQHPDKAWKDFAAKLPHPMKQKTALFTTYKLLTGTMFKNMSRQLNGSVKAPLTELKSRNGTLSKNDERILDNFIS
ncbi:MAG: flavodoxin domain-containing protein [Bacteroidales bacterium]|nr:flavodoxin domain-containing protein [Bacteroidales bacterium]MCF8377549.1 flavodoxin domain-containing protein [Bacteroidales bacterium]MCF8401785.1 flavodoxin domain-containing protein [Bacteroidales bacterium]